jgi:signal transduction histidine kinase
MNVRKLFTAAGLMLLLGWSACSIVLATEPKRVVILHSFGPDVKPWSDYAQAIRAELNRQSRWALEIHEHSLVTARFSDENPEIPFVSYLDALFAKRQPDLIISIGAPAAAFVQRHRQRLFPRAPMLFTVVDQRRVQYSVLTDNDAVVAVAIDYRAAFENILQVLPDTNHVAVVVGNSPIEKYWKEEIGREVQPLANRVSLTWYDGLSFEDILKHAATLPPRSAIFWELMVVDAAGVSHEEDKALARLYAVANAPIFTYTDAFFGREVVGGPHVPVLESGKKTAEVAVRILNGEKAGDIKTPPVGMGTPKFDWREIRRWNISESRLPPGSEIQFRSLTAWEQYRWQVLLVSAAVFLQAGLIFWLLYEHRQRHRAEVMARNTMSELTQMNRLATAGELSASIAHEVNQPLSAMVANANAALNWLAASNIENARNSLRQIVSSGQRAGAIVINIRSMFSRTGQDRKPVDINEILKTVVSVVQIDLERNQIALETQLDDVPAVAGNQIQLQQVILNLITNAIESMRAVIQPRVLRIRSELKQPDLLHVAIEDTGTGIDPSIALNVFKPLITTKDGGMGMGLSICQSIITSHGGRIWVEPASKRGSIFQFEIPVTAPEAGGKAALV